VNTSPLIRPPACRTVTASEAQPGDEEALHGARIVRVSVRPDDVEITFASGTRWRLLPFQELLVYRADP